MKKLAKPRTIKTTNKRLSKGVLPKFSNQDFSMLQEDRDFARWLSKDIAVLDYFAGSTDKVPRELWITLETLRVKKGISLFVELLYALTHKYFLPKEAQATWEAVVKHKHKLSELLGRDVGMKVAALDYLDKHPGQNEGLQLLPDDDLDSLLLFANKDGLTGLHNHRYFQERLRYEIVRSKRYRHVFSLLFIDLDRFKKYNDSYGHLKGDILIREISNFLKFSCRQADVVCRYGGDEFAIILPETNGQQALVLGCRLCSRFLEHHFGLQLHALPKFISLSIGMATYPKNGRLAEELIDAADSALYRAKKAGRNCICHGKRILRRVFKRK